MGLESRIEELVERVDQLEKKNRDLEEENNRIKQDYRKIKQENKQIKAKLFGRNSSKNGNKISRRGFLKKLGVGAAGLGAFGLASASGLKLTRNGISGSSGLDFLDSGSEYFSLSSGGPLKLNSVDLDLSGNTITDSTQDYLDLTGDGNNVRIGTGQAIEDGSGFGRVEILSNGSYLHGEGGSKDNSLGLKNESKSYLRMGKNDFDFIDRKGSFSAFKYYSSSSAPGTLELTNARLYSTENNIVYEGTGFETGFRLFNRSTSSATPTVNFENDDTTGTARLWGKVQNGTMEILAEDGDGNTTTIS